MPQLINVVGGDEPVQVEFPDDMSREEIEADLRARFPAPAPPPERSTSQVTLDPASRRSTVSEEFRRSLENYGGSWRTLIDSFDNAEDAALKGIELQDQLSQKYGRPVSIEETIDAFQNDGVIGAAAQVAKDAPRAVVGQIPHMAVMLAGTKFGSAAGLRAFGKTPQTAAVAGTVGAVIGGAGAVYPLHYAQNIMRQAEADLAAGREVDVNRLTAATAAVAQSGLEYGSMLFMLGKGAIRKALGVPFKANEAATAQKLLDASRRSLGMRALRGAARGVVAEVPTELSQQVIERSQAGLDLLSEDALQEYGEIIYQTALVAPVFGGVAGAVQRTPAPRTQPQFEDLSVVRPAGEISEIAEAAAAADLSEVTEPSPGQITPTTLERAAAETAVSPETLALREATQEKIRQITPILEETLKGRGLSDVGFRLSQSLTNIANMRNPEEIKAVFDPAVRTIFLAADRVAGFEGMPEPQLRTELAGLLDHEMVHAMVELGLWNTSEWNVLESTVQNRTNRQGVTYLKAAQKAYSKDTPKVQREEAVAELIRDTFGGRSGVAGRPLNLIRRIIEFFRKLGNSIVGSGFASFNQIVSDIETGIIGARERVTGGIPEPMAAARDVPVPEPVVTPSRVRPDVEVQQYLPLGEGLTAEELAIDRALVEAQKKRQAAAKIGLAQAREILAEDPKKAARGPRAAQTIKKAKAGGFNELGRILNEWRGLQRNPPLEPLGTEDVISWFHGTADKQRILDEGFKSYEERSGSYRDPVFWFSSAELVSETYKPQRATKFDPDPAIMEVYLRGKNPLIFDAEGKSWSNLEVGGLADAVDYSINPEGFLESIRSTSPQLLDVPLSSTKDEQIDYLDSSSFREQIITSDRVARIARGMGYDGVIFNRMRDVGPEYYASLDQSQLSAKDVITGQPDFPIIPEQALEKSGVSTVMALFRPRVKGIWTRQGLPDPTATRIRSSEAQFDPEARGSTNILAARGPKMGALTEFVQQNIPPSVAEKDRLARARQQGFDTDRVWYHGTPNEFMEFDENAWKERGARTMPGYFNDLGFFFSNKRKLPSQIGKVIPVYSRVRNPWRGDVEQLADFLADKNPEFIKSDFQHDSRGQRDMQRGLQELGYDGIIMKAMVAQGEEWLIVFNPNDVRSIRAEFDPQRAESANLLAAREGAVSSIYPTAGGRVANPLEEILVGNYEDFVSGPTFTKNMLIVKGYDNLRKDRTLRTDKQKANAFVDHLKDNLLYVYDSIDPAIRERSGQWYEGANKIAQELADQYNLSLEQASAALANLSPQKDWYINLSLGERLLDTYFNKQDLPFTDEMRAKAQQIFLTPPDKPTPRSLANFEKLKKAYSVIEGKSLSQLTEQGEEAFAKAMWVRLYDQTYNDPAYQIVSPEGERVAVAKNLDGSNSKIAWGSLVEIAKSIKAIENSDLNSISESLGGANKVRNFYNNIYNPDAEEGFVTIDTHAVVAGLLKPVGGSSPEASANFGTVKGGSSSSITGYRGIYALYEEAYRRAAQERNILPRQLQSIVWEGGRSLFSPSYRSSSINRAFVNDVWKQYNKKRITLAEAQQRIIDNAEGFSKPVWDRPASSVSQASRVAPDEGELLDDGVSRQGRPRVGGRGRVDAPRRDTDQDLKTSPEQSDALAADKLKAARENRGTRESEQAAENAAATTRKLAARSEVSDLSRNRVYQEVASISSQRAARGLGNAETALSWEAPTSAHDWGFVYNVQDKFIDLAKTEEAINEGLTGQGLTPLSAIASPYKGEESMHGIIKNQMREFEDTELEPLVEKLIELNIERTEFDTFLVLRHAVERNAHIRDINSKKTTPDAALEDGGAGSIYNEQTQQAERLLDDYVKGRMLNEYGFRWNDSTNRWEGGNQRGVELEGIAKDYDEITKGTLKILQRDGLISEKDYNFLSDYYAYYAPLRGQRIDDDIAAEEHHRAGTGVGNLGIRGTEIETATGRVSVAFPPTGSTVAKRLDAIVRGSKNVLVGQRLLDLVRNYPNTDYWNVFSEIPSSLATVRELFGVKEGGKQFYIQLNDKRLREALLNLDAPQAHKVIRGLGALNRVLSFMSTSLNPPFIISNFLKDSQMAMYTLAAEQTITGGRALDTKGLHGQVFADLLPSIRQVYRGLRGKNLKPELQKEWDDYLASGAKTEWFHAKDPEQSLKTIDDMIAMANGSFKGTVRNAWNVTGDLISHLNSAVENGIRFAVFKKARAMMIKNGVDAAEATARSASLSKNLTVNFNRKGNQGQLLNSLFLFFNASVQGTANVVRAVKNSRTVQGMAAAATTMAAMLTLLNEAFSEEDEFEESYYDNIDDFEKERNIIIMKTIFFPETENPQQAYKIPLPWGFNVFWLFGVQMAEISMGQKTIQKASTDMLGAVLGSFSPLGFGESEDVWKFGLKGVSPQVMKPFVEIALNENFFGAPVYRDNFDFGRQLPLSNLSMPRTPEAFKATTEFMNAMTFGNENESGLMGWLSPDMLRHFFNTYTGGAGRFTERALTMPSKLVSGDDIPVNEIPFLRRLLVDASYREGQSNYYERREDILAKSSQVLVERGADRTEYVEKNRGYLLMKRFLSNSDKRIRRINAALNDLDQAMLRATSPEIRLRIQGQQEKLQEQKKRVYGRFNQRFDEVMEKLK